MLSDTTVKLKWSEHFPPNGGKPSGDDLVSCYYDHKFVETPFGIATIEWKSWKEYDPFMVCLDGDYIDTANTEGEASEIVLNRILEIRDKAQEFIQEVVS